MHCRAGGMLLGLFLGLLVLEHGPADAGQGDDRAGDLIDLIEADHALGDEETAGGAEAVADEGSDVGIHFFLMAL